MSAPGDATPRSPLARARSAVLNVLIAVGAGIALSGWWLRRVDVPDHPASLSPWRIPSHLGLVGLIVASVAARRLLRGRAGGDADRYVRAHLAGAVLGALAVPLGLAYAAAAEPTLPAVAPFWAAALVLGLLSLPRPGDAPPPSGTEVR